MAEIDSYDDVIGGGDSDGLADLDGKDADNSIEDVLATHPTLSPIAVMFPTPRRPSPAQAATGQGQIPGRRANWARHAPADRP